MRTCPLGGLLVFAACSKSEPPAPKPEMKPPVAVRFGDCAAPDTAWISGPAPDPFDDALAAKRGRVPITTIDELPIRVEHTRWEDAVPQIRVPRAEVASTDSEMPAGDDAAMLELRFRPKGAYSRFGQSDPTLSSFEIFVAVSADPLARCFTEGGRVGFSQNVHLRFTLTPHPARTSVDKIVIDGVPDGATACIKKILRGFDITSPPDGPLDVSASFELRRDPDRPPPPPAIDHLFDPERRRGPDLDYKPSAHNPLVASAPSITECLEASREPYGAVVVDLAKHAAHGVDDRTATCLATATKSITADLRCSLAYGRMPIADLPTIDVAEAPSGLDLAARQAKLRGSSPPVVAIYGVNVIRAKDDTPMKAVHREISNVLMANEDFLLARSTKSGWELFDPPNEPFPIIPVPVGTGSFWNRVAAPGKPGADCDCVYHSLLATKTSVWFSISRTNDQVEIKRDAKFATALAAELKRQKASQFFQDRTDIEIAATDDSTYGQLLDLVIAARAGGFPDWQLHSVETLHARPTLGD